MHLVRHRVARRELAAGRMPGDDDSSGSGKFFSSASLRKKLVDEIERRERRIRRRHPAGAPAVAAVGPAHFIRLGLVGAGNERGEMTIVSSSAPARNAAAMDVSK